jgi:paraquat-inducible protein B
MKSKVNPAAIGMFMTGAVVIIFVSLILFGSGALFRKTKSYLLTFQEPVTGLSSGAPVKILGATVGEVSEIWLGAEEDTGTPMINVVIAIDRNRFASLVRDYSIDFDNRERFDRAVNERGLRGQLVTQSMLSGQLYIALDQIPDAPGFQMNRENEHGYWEIPTMPSTQREMMASVRTALENLTDLDLEGISTQLKGLLTDIRHDLSIIEFDKVNARLVSSLDEVDSLLTSDQLKSALTNLNATLHNTEAITSKLNHKVDPLLTDVRDGLARTADAFEEASQALADLRRQVRPGSPLSDQLLETLARAGRSLEALRELAQQLERNPNVILTGRSPRTAK